jgi:hypothetical protein
MSLPAMSSTLVGSLVPMKLELHFLGGLVCQLNLRLHASLLTKSTGPVTDYGSSMVQWIRTRRPRYKCAHRLETERPSASYAVDVRGILLSRFSGSSLANNSVRCFLPWVESMPQLTQFPSGICINQLVNQRSPSQW